MLYATHYQLLEPTDNTPDFVIRLRQELKELDERLATLPSVFNQNSTLLMNCFESKLLERQYKAMDTYYYTLIERGKHYKIVEYCNVEPNGDVGCCCAGN